MAEIGAVGNLIGASLETVGHYTQSSLLDVLQGGYANSLASLLYVLGALIALFTVAVGGNYKFGTWFLFGPAIFIFIISTRVDSTGANWQFGVVRHSDEAVFKATDRIVDRESGAVTLAERDPARVSWFFSFWNTASSDIIQAFISLLKLENTKSQRTFINKMQRYDYLMNARVMDPKVRMFTELLMVKSCARYFGLLMHHYQLGRDIGEQVASGQELDQLGNEPRAHISEIQAVIRQFRSTIWSSQPPDEWPGITQVQDILSRDGDLTCKELWELGVITYLGHAEEVLGIVADFNRPEGLTSVEAKNKLMERWGYSDFAVEPDGTETQIGVLTLDANQKYISMLNEVAVRMLFKEMGSIIPSIAQLRVDRHPPKRKPGSVESGAENARAIRLYSAREEFRGKGDFLTAVFAMPYLQGMVLYYLAFLFPFFAMALLIPGRYHGFMLWMGLWFWVKSWDFGFAVVMLLEEILYKLLPTGKPIVGDELSDPGTALSKVLEVDPTYSVHTYYNIMATCMWAVPVLTGVLIKKGGGDVVQAVSQGFHNFSGKIGGAMSAYQGSKIAQRKAAESAEYLFRAQIAGMERALSSSVIQGMLGASLAANALGHIQQSRENIQKKRNQQSHEDHQRAMETWQTERDTALSQGRKPPPRPERKKPDPLVFSSNDATKLMGGLRKILASKGQELAFDLIELEAQKAVYQASISNLNKQRSRDAALVGYYSHGFERPYYSSQLMSFQQKLANLGTAGLIDKSTAALLKKYTIAPAKGGVGRSVLRGGMNIFGQEEMVKSVTDFIDEKLINQ